MRSKLMNGTHSLVLLMARILLATTPDSAEPLLELLAGHDVCQVQRLAEAERLILEDGFELVVCDVDFDDSQMFDLFKAVKQSKSHTALPFVGVRITSSQQHSILFSNLQNSARVLGMSDYVDLEQIGSEQNSSEQNMVFAAMRERVLKHLPSLACETSPSPAQSLDSETANQR